ncbi:MAG: arsenate reductase ArsC, partial [Fimbriimonadales bacterium]|nr:arsenate reductase ArsC [Fimbriimonadales bacterium]
MSGCISILVVCTGNRFRSQMAEGWLRHFGGERVEVASAGALPSFVSPYAIQAMAEAGVDISGQRSKSIEEFQGREFDYVITVCDSAREMCPFFPHAAHRIHHSFEDPQALIDAGADPVEVTRRIRDEIRDWAKGFLREVLPEIGVEG